MARATESDRASFERLRQPSEPLDEPAVLISLAAMFERLKAIRRIHGPLAEAGVWLGEDYIEPWERFWDVLEPWQSAP